MPKRGVPELCLVIALLAACKRPETPPPARPPVVEVVRVEQRDVPIYREWIATLDGYVNAQIQPRVSGYVIAQRFKEGSFVRKNELLFEIDARPFRAALDQANAQLAERRADAARAARDVERDRPLAEARAIPRSQLDNDIQIHNAAVAAVDAARATAHQAELDVGFTRVGSLIDGIVGIAEVQVGNLVSPTSVLTTVSQIDPIRAWFAISEQEYLDVADLLHGASVPAGAGTGAGTAASRARVRAHADRWFKVSSCRPISVREPTGRLLDRNVADRDGVSKPATPVAPGSIRSRARRDAD